MKNQLGLWSSNSWSFLFCLKGGDNDVEKIRQNAVKVRINLRESKKQTTKFEGDV